MAEIVETRRLKLVEADLSDGPFIFELMNSPGWLEHIGDRGIRTIEDARNYIQNSLINSYQTNGYGLYKMILKKNNTPIGICGLVNRPTLDRPDIGFAILPEYERHGYTYEASFGIIQFAKVSLQFDKLLAITSPDNEASQRLLEKLGMHKEEIIQSSNDKEETVLFSLQFK